MDSPAALPEIPGWRGREVLGRIGDKWSLYVIHLLGGGTRRFGELRRHIGGITPRMLTVTIRSLERDGLVSRTVYPVVPPRVEYALTPLGKSLLQAATTLLLWVACRAPACAQRSPRRDPRWRGSPCTSRVARR
jgi:DNA-binding HxlR family transcriptional regulator